MLVSRPRSLGASGEVVAAPSAGTWDLPGTAAALVDVFDEAGFAQVQSTIGPFGARVDRFLGGSMLITLTGRGTPTDQATQAARCALRLKALLPRASLAVSTGRAELGGELPVGQVIDWVARLLAGEKGGVVCLDQSTAELVERNALRAPVGRHRGAGAGPRVPAFLGGLWGVPFPGDGLPALRAARADPRLLADQVLTAWLDWLEAECAARPVLLVLEDLQWGDAASLQLVDAALRTLRERPLLVMAFARPEVNDKFPGLWNERDVQRMALPPLTSKA